MHGIGNAPHGVKLLEVLGCLGNRYMTEVRLLAVALGLYTWTSHRLLGLDEARWGAHGLREHRPAHWLCESRSTHWPYDHAQWRRLRKRDRAQRDSTKKAVSY